jgi:hypothetical protein
MSDARESGNRAVRLPYGRGLAVTAVLWGISAALRDAWTCDDAFIVFRYAKNLAQGVGLVFNPGERVEGFTDLLWVLASTPAFRLGIAPETWTNLWGVLAYAGAIGLLAFDHGRVRARFPSPVWAAIPLAALGAAANGEWNAWATSGLETSLFTFLLVAGYVVLVGPLGNGFALVGGVLFGLATLTRPDGVIPAVVGGLFVLWKARRLGPAVAYATGFAALWIPAAAFRLSYYGSLVPNTYWAKSAGVAWWDQGLRYVSLHLAKYGILALAPALLLLVSLRNRREDLSRPSPFRELVLSRIVLAGAIAATYVLYLMRVGGDFMFGRMLVPVLPFLLALLELGWTNLPSTWSLPAVLGAGLLPLVLPSFIPRPVTATRQTYGVANEWEYYDLKRTTETDFRAACLRRYFDGLPVRVLVFGAEVRLAYRTDVPVAVEGYGLTDAFIARQPLRSRGRPGHEHLADPAYAVLTRHLDVAFNGPEYERAGFTRFIPVVPIRFGPVAGLLLRWDPDLVSEWRRRGARVPDFPSWLDRYVEEASGKSDEVVRRDYVKFRNFYFTQVSDPAREARFLRRLNPP